MSSKFSEAVRRRFMTAGFRLAAWYAVFFIAGSLAVMTLAYFLLSSSLQKSDRADIMTEYEELDAEYRVGGLSGLKEELGHRVPQPGAETFLIRVTGAKDAAVLISAPAVMKRFDLQAIPIPAAGSPAWSFVGTAHHETMLEVVSGLMPDGRALQVGLDTSSRDEFLEQFRTIAAAVMIPAVLLGLAGGAILTRRALLPLRHLIGTVRVIEAGSLEARVPVTGTGDELDEAGSLFNSMLDRISGLVSGMRAALDNVAHDLRTPMTRLRAVAEAALTNESSAEARGEALSDCIEESERVLLLLNALMDISEAETGVMKLKLERTRLAALISEVVEVYSYAAEDKGLKLSAEVNADITVQCDRARLRQALANLLDNAVKYSPSGTGIMVSLAAEGKDAVISVADRGPGIPEKDLPRIWDRLYRGDSSRHEKGLGLGLSVVRAVAMAHGGSATVSTKPGAGSVFTFRIPAA